MDFLSRVEIVETKPLVGVGSSAPVVEQLVPAALARLDEPPSALVLEQDILIKEPASSRGLQHYVRVHRRQSRGADHDRALDPRLRVSREVRLRDRELIRIRNQSEVAVLYSPDVAIEDPLTVLIEKQVLDYGRDGLVLAVLVRDLVVVLASAGVRPRVPEGVDSESERA